MNPTKLASRAAAFIVAGVAGYSSWQHIVEVAKGAGEHATVALVLPLSIDGLIIVGTMAMLDDKRNNLTPRLSARAALGVGIVATLAANVASAEPTWTARAVAAVPAVAFLIAVEVLSRSGKPRPGTSAPEPVRPSAPERPKPTAEPGPDGADVPAEVPARKPQAKARPAAAAAPKAQKRPAEVVRRTAEEMLSADPTPTRKAVAAEIGITDRRLRQVLNEPTGEQPVAVRTPAEVSA